MSPEQLAEAVKNYGPLKENSSKEEMQKLLVAEGFDDEAIKQILAELYPAATANGNLPAGAPGKKEASAALTEFDELEIKKESNGEKFTGATVMKVIRKGVKIHPDSALRLNLHAHNSNIVYVPTGIYKISDLIPASVMLKVSPDANWVGK